MLIYARFDGKCARCGGPTRKGDEIEYFDRKAYHPACIAELAQEPAVDTFSLAGNLGFIESDIVERDSFSEIHAGWQMWNLRVSNRSDSAGRTAAAPHSQSTPTLF